MTTKTALFVEGNRNIKSIVCLDEKAIKFNKDSKRAGDTYRKYRYNGIVFICDDEEFFTTPVADMGYVKLLQYQETIQDEENNDVVVNRFEFDSYGLKSEDLAEREHEVAMESVGKDNFSINEDILAKLQALQDASVTA